MTDDFDPRLIMLNRRWFFDKFMSPRTVWKVAYRSWRANRRIAGFPLNCVVMSKRDTGNSDVDWIRIA